MTFLNPQKIGYLRISAYVGEGQNRWTAAHVLDVARLYRLVLEKNENGAKYHAVAEEGVYTRDIAEVIGRGLKVPVKSIPPEEAEAHFGSKKLGWNPTGTSLIADLEQMDYRG